MTRVGSDDGGFSSRSARSASGSTRGASGTRPPAPPSRTRSEAFRTTPQRGAVVLDATRLKPQREEGQRAFRDLAEASSKLGVRVELIVVNAITKMQIARILRENGVHGWTIKIAGAPSVRGRTSMSQVPVEEAPVRAAVERFYAALEALITGGGSEPMRAAWHHTDRVTAAHPLGDWSYGWKEILATWEVVAGSAPPRTGLLFHSRSAGAALWRCCLFDVRLRRGPAVRRRDGQLHERADPRRRRLEARPSSRRQVTGHRARTRVHRRHRLGGLRRPEPARFSIPQRRCCSGRRSPGPLLVPGLLVVLTRLLVVIAVVLDGARLGVHGARVPRPPARQVLPATIGVDPARLLILVARATRLPMTRRSIRTCRARSSTSRRPRHAAGSAPRLASPPAAPAALRSTSRPEPRLPDSAWRRRCPAMRGRCSSCSQERREATSVAKSADMNVVMRRCPFLISNHPHVGAGRSQAVDVNANGRRSITIRARPRLFESTKPSRTRHSIRRRRFASNASSHHCRLSAIVRRMSISSPEYRRPTGPLLRAPGPVLRARIVGVEYRKADPDAGLVALLGGKFTSTADIGLPVCAGGYSDRLASSLSRCKVQDDSGASIRLKADQTGRDRAASSRAGQR